MVQNANVRHAPPGLWTVTRLMESRGRVASIAISGAAALHKRLTSAPSFVGTIGWRAARTADSPAAIYFFLS